MTRAPASLMAMLFVVLVAGPRLLEATHRVLEHGPAVGASVAASSCGSACGGAHGEDDGPGSGEEDGCDGGECALCVMLAGMSGEVPMEPGTSGGADRVATAWGSSGAGPSVRGVHGVRARGPPETL